jgi:hypothetical protein
MKCTSILIITALCLAKANVIPPNEVLVSRSPCYTTADGVRCREGPGNNYDVVRVLGNNVWIDPECQKDGGLVDGTRYVLLPEKILAMKTR